jgi:predicted DNA-binding transcriptional regulator YafY
MPWGVATKSTLSRKASNEKNGHVSVCLSHDLLVIVEIVDSQEKPDMLLPMLDGMMSSGLVTIENLRTAIRDQRKLAIEYADEKKKFTERLIWPIQLGFMDTVRIVTGWCELRQDFRFFRTDRMISAKIGDIYPKRRAILLREFQTRFGVGL